MLGFGVLGYRLSSEIEDSENTFVHPAPPPNLRVEQQNCQEFPQKTWTGVGMSSEGRDAVKISPC